MGYAVDVQDLAVLLQDIACSSITLYHIMTPYWCLT